MTPLRTLLQEGVIHLGQKASGNPASMDLPRFAMGVANKDYPAKTPLLWNHVYEKLGMRERNIRTFADPAYAGRIFSALKADPSYLGGDVGVGFKDQVLALLDDIDPLAKVMGAINVVTKTERGLKGYNTDGLGFAESLEAVFRERGTTISGKRIMLLGAGGTASAIAFATANMGANVTVLNRTKDKATALAERVNDYFKKVVAWGMGRDQISQTIASADAVVAVIDDKDSPLDQYSALGTIELPATPERIAENLREAGELQKRLKPGAIVADVMLRSADTATISLAKSAGLTTLDGLPMVFNQAVEAFRLVNLAQLEELGVDKNRIASLMREVI